MVPEILLHGVGLVSEKYGQILSHYLQINKLDICIMNSCFIFSVSKD